MEIAIVLIINSGLKGVVAFKYDYLLEFFGQFINFSCTKQQ